MSILLYGIVHVAVAVFIVACAVRAVRYASQPVHLRWELYPVPHEPPERVRHGGSYFEEGEWWTRPRRLNRWGELKSMIPEMLFMKGLWEFNPCLWRRSFPFHFGLYLSAKAIALLVLTACLSVLDPEITAGTLGSVLHWAYTITGFSGLALTLFGAIALLARRLTAADLKGYTTIGDVFNLGWFILAFGSLLVGLLTRSADDPGVVEFVSALLTFDADAPLPGSLVPGLLLSAGLLAYIPFTHMAHFIGKYFTYHAIRWNDSPNLPGGRMERRLAEYLTYRPTWAAPHVKADGTKTWAEVAGTNPTQGGKP